MYCTYVCTIEPDCWDYQVKLKVELVTKITYDQVELFPVLGEVFVLDDGGEVDLDLGNYERFLGIRLRQDNNITMGKIYKQVIDRERKGDYLGKKVQGRLHGILKIPTFVNFRK